MTDAIIVIICFWLIVFGPALFAALLSSVPALDKFASKLLKRIEQ
jgi:hypothetical protein